MKFMLNVIRAIVLYILSIFFEDEIEEMTPDFPQIPSKSYRNNVMLSEVIIKTNQRTRNLNQRLREQRTGGWDTFVEQNAMINEYFNSREAVP